MSDEWPGFPKKKPGKPKFPGLLIGIKPPYDE
jgi:hypothetical protein